MRYGYRLLLATFALLVPWIVGASFGTWVGFPIGLLAAYLAMLFTQARPPKEKTVWHFENLKQPFNVLLVGGVVSLHIGIQVFLSIIGLDLILHVIIFFGMAPAHILTALIGVLEKPPKPTTAQIRTRRRKTWKDWLFGSPNGKPGYYD